jgi:hypothetical protein
MTMDDIPKHRFELTLTMGANTFDDLMGALAQLDWDIRDRPGGRYIGHGEEPDGDIQIASSTPYSLDIKFYPDVTAESHNEALQAWVADYKRSKETADA